MRCPSLPLAAAFYSRCQNVLGERDSSERQSEGSRVGGAGLALAVPGRGFGCERGPGHGAARSEALAGARGAGLGPATTNGPDTELGAAPAACSPRVNSLITFSSAAFRFVTKVKPARGVYLCCALPRVVFAAGGVCGAVGDGAR